MFKKIQRETGRLNRKIGKLRQADAKLSTSLQKKRNELARIIDKQQICRVDLELDQIMTCFKISFANICCHLLTECLHGEKMTLQRPSESVFGLRGQMRIQNGQRHVLIERNPKQEASAFDVINHMEIKDINGHIYNFDFPPEPGHRVMDPSK